MESFRFIHISDLHFSDKNPQHRNIALCQETDLGTKALQFLFDTKKFFYPSSHNSDATIDLYNLLMRELPYLDALIATGDLATKGSKEDLSTALDYFTGKADVYWGQNNAPIHSLIDSTLPVILMPGNHDRYKRFLTPGGTEFEQHFEENWCLNSKQNLIIREVSNEIKKFHFAKGNENVLLYCIDFTLRPIEKLKQANPYKFLGQGEAHMEIIEELKTEMAYGTNQNDFVIWAIHFSPQDVPDELSLVGKNVLMVEAKGLGVSMILCGHTHTQNHQLLNDIHVLCSGTTCSMEHDDGDGNCFWDIEFDIDNGTLLELRNKTFKFDDDLGFIEN